MENSNQPAFPAIVEGEPVSKRFPHGTDDVQFSGLTKREYFAAMAMQGLIAHPTIGKHRDFYNLSIEAILYANELLIQLEK